MIEESFKEFCENLDLDNYSDMEKTVKDIAKKLNKHYYETDDTEEHMYIVGSVGRGTAIKNTSDLDILFDLPREVYNRINDNDGNGQSQLLQEVKNVLKEKYTNTDFKGDGQVVVINFSKYTIELVPGFKNSDNSFDYPDSNDGGKWRTTNPIPEITKCKKLKEETKDNFTNICHMIRTWKNKDGFKFKGLLIDTLSNKFLEDNPKYKNCNYSDYFNLIVDLFEFLKNQDKNQSFWFALGSNQKIYNDDGGKFIRKAEKTYDKLKDLYENIANLNSVLRDIFGRNFPRSESIEENKKYISYSNTEQYIEEIYPVDILCNLSLNCIVTQDGFRPASLREMIENHIFLKKDKKLNFFIENESQIRQLGVNKILWKVKNEGEVAKQKNMIRGQIVETNLYTHNEHTDFNGNHYVEAYIIKNGVCIGKGKIDVPIKI